MRPTIPGQSLGTGEWGFMTREMLGVRGDAGEALPAQKISAMNRCPLLRI